MILDPVRCRDLVEVVTEWLEGALPEARAAEVEEHLAICPDCVRYVDQMRDVTGVLHRTADGDVPEHDFESHERLLRAFRQWTA